MLRPALLFFLRLLRNRDGVALRLQSGERLVDGAVTVLLT
jgi:hypothetical protein